MTTPRSNPGTLHLLYGLVGSGKSTLARHVLVAGIHAVLDGNVWSTERRPWAVERAGRLRRASPS